MTSLVRSNSNTQDIINPNASQGINYENRILDEYECNICFTTSLNSNEIYCCEDCHSIFCLNCMRTYVEIKIKDGQISDKLLVCPAPNDKCVCPLTDATIHSLVSSEIWEKYMHYVESRHQGIRFCPVKHCSAILKEPRFSMHRKVSCQVCNKKSCIRCGKKYHKIGICRSMENKFKRYTRHHDVRGCPNCFSRIEKNGGCIHMTCSQCQHEYCWWCLKPWNRSHANCSNLVEAQDRRFIRRVEKFAIACSTDTVYYVVFVSCCAIPIVGITAPAVGAVIAITIISTRATLRITHRI